LSNSPPPKKEGWPDKKSPNKKLDSVALRTNKLHDFQEKATEFFKNLTLKLSILSSPSIILNESEKNTVDSALERAPKEEKKRTDWFTEDEKTCPP
jgi:hypothetical protein